MSRSKEGIDCFVALLPEPSLGAAKELLPQIYGSRCKMAALGMSIFRAGGMNQQYHRIEKKLLFIAAV